MKISLVLAAVPLLAACATAPAPAPPRAAPFGLSAPGGTIRRGWEIFRTKLPLTAEELQHIANNRPRFAR